MSNINDFIGKSALTFDLSKAVAEDPFGLSFKTGADAGDKGLSSLKGDGKYFSAVSSAYRSYDATGTLTWTVTPVMVDAVYNSFIGAGYYDPTIDRVYVLAQDTAIPYGTKMVELNTLTGAIVNTSAELNQTMFSNLSVFSTGGLDNSYYRIGNTIYSHHKSKRWVIKFDMVANTLTGEDLDETSDRPGEMWFLSWDSDENHTDFKFEGNNHEAVAIRCTAPFLRPASSQGYCTWGEYIWTTQENTSYPDYTGVRFFHREAWFDAMEKIMQDAGIDRTIMRV